MKIYTRRGDRGETSLAGGKRVKKDALRVEAYGEVDELNSVLGWALAVLQDADLREDLSSVQEDLFAIQAQLADPAFDPAKAKEKTRVTAGRIERFEKSIDRCMAEVGRLKSFVLPGGSPASAALHVARAVCRRAERRVVALAGQEAVPEHAIRYLNRLSDLLFALAVLAHKRSGVELRRW
ncbi:MAG: cob(I)yrinic acid a,c-diamide adenosyltransferase [Nitrospirae bacterium]|nr:cob(I)yrinic acid a,c-diamide adenosyltransferase [Nitrospirota bacterium]